MKRKFKKSKRRFKSPKERVQLKERHGRRLWERINKISREALTTFEAEIFDKYENELEHAIAEVVAISNKWRNEAKEYAEDLNHTRTTFVPFAEKIDHNFSSPISPSVGFKIKAIIEDNLRYWAYKIFSFRLSKDQNTSRQQSRLRGNDKMLAINPSWNIGGFFCSLKQGI